MRPVDVGVGHQNDLVVAQLGDVKVILTDTGAHGLNEKLDFLRRKHLIVASFFDIENLTAQRQHGLGSLVPTLLGGAAGGITLD